MPGHRCQTPNSRVTQVCCVQVHQCSAEPDAAGAGSLRAAEGSRPGRERGDLSRHLSHRCCFGGNTLQV